MTVIGGGGRGALCSTHIRPFSNDTGDDVELLIIHRTNPAARHVELRRCFIHQRPNLCISSERRNARTLLFACFARAKDLVANRAPLAFHRGDRRLIHQLTHPRRITFHRLWGWVSRPRYRLESSEWIPLEPALVCRHIDYRAQ